MNAIKHILALVVANPVDDIPGYFVQIEIVLDFTSPAKTTWPVVTSVSQATLDWGSKAKK
jgi:hypothetical protein